jgi:hypothetical protein
LLCREGWRGCRRDNDIDLELNEFGCDFGDTFAASFRPSNLDRNRSSLDPSKFTQARHKASSHDFVAEAEAAPKNPIVGNFSRCCPRAASGPRGRRAANQRYELAASHALPQAEERILPHRLMALLCITAQLHR